MIAAPFLDALEAAAEAAEAAEGRFRREAAERLGALEKERAVAFRRLNLMRAMAEAVADAADADAAAADARATLRARLGWDNDSEARTEVLARFAAVGRAVFSSLSPADDEAPCQSVDEALAEFEAWYAATRTTPFWTLFEHYMPETPLVDF
jgi:hypothetical protein